jgi:aspartate aminotransferase
MIVVNSCSKNFGLYRERTGGLSIITASEQSSRAAASQIASIARGIYSMPPDHGASVVAEILLDPALRQQWDNELAEVRQRINALRTQLVSALKQRNVAEDFGFIEREKGMFSFLGLSVAQVQTLVTDYSVYLVDSSRINVAGINNSNIDYLADAIAKVVANPSA